MYNQPNQNQPREPEVKPLFTIHYQLLTIRAFTLIELLVVMTIMVMLVAISVPMLKPMFESQKTKNAAQTVAAALQRVRFKAMEDQATYGIQFVPFETNKNVSLQMRLVKNGNYALNEPNFRVKVNSGTVECYKWDDDDPKWVRHATSDPRWSAIVQIGYKIQFGRQGIFYTIRNVNTTNNTATIVDSNGVPIPLTLPDLSYSDAMEFKLLQALRPTLTPPVVLPKGTVVDLPFSGGYAGSGNYKTFAQFYYNVMFTPNGDIDYFDGNYNAFYGGLIYFCIGEWDRQVDSANNTLAEDGKNNIQTMTNFWVTLHPRTGAVRITEMAPAANNADVNGARKFATEHFGISE